MAELRPSTKELRCYVARRIDISISRVSTVGTSEQMATTVVPYRVTVVLAMLSAQVLCIGVLTLYGEPPARLITPRTYMAGQPRRDVVLAFDAKLL